MLRTYRYAKIADELRQQIGRGDFDAKKLPSERALMTQYGVQRSTVRRALSLLQEEGRIIASNKRGSFVNPVESIPAPPPTEAATGSILVVAQWNKSSTALESLLRGLTETLTPLPQLSLLTFDSKPQQGRVQNTLPDADFLITHGVKGIVLWPQSPADVPALMRLREIAPLILVDRQVAGLETHSVVFDDFAGGRAVTRYLLGMGHRRIGFLTDEVFAETVQQRWRGYVLGLEDAGIVADPACYGLFAGMSDPPYTAQMRLFLEGGGHALTAVVCSNDMVALDFIHFLRREGRGVPGEVAVTGFGNLLPNSMDAVRLTTVRQPFDEAGRAIGKILLSQFMPPASTESAPFNYCHVTVPVHLVARP